MVAGAASLTPTERIKIGSWEDASGKLQRNMPDRFSAKYLMTQAAAADEHDGVFRDLAENEEDSTLVLTLCDI